MSDTDPITALARKCATSGLRLRAARALFNALYLADALAMERGNAVHAAARAGVNRETFLRWQRGAEE